MSPEELLANAKPQLDALVEQNVQAHGPAQTRALLLRLTSLLLEHIDALGRLSPGRRRRPHETSRGSFRRLVRDPNVPVADDDAMENEYKPKPPVLR